MNKFLTALCSETARELIIYNFIAIILLQVDLFGISLPLFLESDRDVQAAQKKITK